MLPHPSVTGPWDGPDKTYTKGQNMIIRIATGQDEIPIQELIYAVYQEFGFGWDPEGYHADIYNLEAHFQDPSRFWVAEECGQIIGCIGLEVFKAIPGPTRQIIDTGRLLRIAGADCELVRLYTYPQVRGKGIGRQLAEQCIHHARDAGCKLMEIWSDTNLKDAHKLYSKLGAVEVGKRICPPPDEDPEYGFYLELV